MSLAGKKDYLFLLRGGNGGGALEPMMFLKGKNLSQCLKSWQGNAQELSELQESRVLVCTRWVSITLPDSIE